MTEIFEWKEYSNEERERILRQLAKKSATHRCPSCGEPAYCGISAGQQSCWCFDIENRDIPVEQNTKLCLCRQCLLKTPKRSSKSKKE
jgi:hypothetical protein